MASSLIRLALSRTSFPAVRRAVLPRLFPALNQTISPPRKFISTSGNNKDSITATHGSAVDKKYEVENLEEKDENWISYGYSLVDRDTDEFYHHTIMFFGLTIVMCGTFVYFAYYPDFGHYDWFHREACLELERREKLGLPLVDQNLLDPARINLPSDEELGEYDIII